MQKLRDWLYIGNYTDLVSDWLKEDKSINVILNLAEEISLDDKKMLFIDIDDGVPISDANIFRGIEFLLDNYHREEKLLVVCGAGISRSVSYCTMIIKELEDRTLIDSFREIKKLYPKALPHPEVWKSICEAYEEEFDYAKVIK